MPMFADSIRNLAAALIISAIIIAALVLGQSILIPLSLGILLAFILDPVVRLTTVKWFPRPAAVITVMVVLLIAVVAASLAFSTQILILTSNIDNYKSNLVEKVRDVSGSRSDDNLIRRAARAVNKLETAVTKEVSGTPSTPTDAATPAPTTDSGSNAAKSKKDGSGQASWLDALAAAIAPLTHAGLTVLFAAFLLVQSKDLRDRVVRVTGTDHMTSTTSALSEAGERLSRLFLRQAMLNTAFGIVVTALLYLIGVPNAVLWGASSIALRFVPFIGSILAAVPPTLLAAAVDPGWGMVIATLAVFVVGESLMGQVIEPLVLGDSAGLSPFAMILAAGFFALVWGPIGLLLAAPITMMLVVIGQYVPRLEFLSVLLGNEPALSPSQQFYFRLLSGDSGAATSQLQDAVKAAGLVEVASGIVLPALRLAERDRQLDRFDDEQLEAITLAMGDVTDALIAVVQPKQPQTRDTTDAGTGAGDILVLPARGPIDQAAAYFVARVLETSTGVRAETTDHATGLMALSTAGATPDGFERRALVISTVGAMRPSHLSHLVRRAVDKFPLARLVVSDWGSDTSLSGVLPSAAPGESAANRQFAWKPRLGDVVGSIIATEPATRGAVRTLILPNQPA